MRSVKEVMESNSLLVIGASRNPFKPGSMLLHVLRESGFRGKVAGVNPQGGEIHGVTLYPSLDEVPFTADMAVLLIPPGAVPEALFACARKGVKGVVIASEGFAETGAAGKQHQQQVRDILRSTGMRGFGPNTLGIVNTETGLTTSYFANQEMLCPGTIGFAAQSGIFIGALLRYLSSFEGLKISKGMGLGNKVDVDEADALNYLADDDQTRTIGLYLEDIRDGRRFLEAAGKAVAQKPVLLLKGGRTRQGALASASHTASMAVDDAVLDGALRQTGVIRMEGIEEMVGSLMGFEWMPLPKGNRVAFVTFSGAQAIMSVDAAIKEGLELAKLSPETRQEISTVLATSSKLHNPIDTYPDMNTHGFEKTTTCILRALLKDDGVDGIVFISFAVPDPKEHRQLAAVIGKHPNKPVFVTLLGGRDDVNITEACLFGQRIPCYPFPEMAVRVFSNMWRYAKGRIGS